MKKGGGQQSLHLRMPCNLGSHIQNRHLDVLNHFPARLWVLSITLRENYLHFAFDMTIATMSPYRPSASAKMRMRIIPTNSFGC